MALVLAQAGLAVVTCVLAVSGVVVATEGTTFPGGLRPTLTVTPTAAVLNCPATGPYRAPERGSVGVPAELSLCPGAARVIGVPGTVLDGWDVRGGVVVDAPDVVIRRSRITGDGSQAFGIRTTGAGSVRIEDVTLTGDFPEAAIGGDRWSAERVEITRVTGDGARLGDASRMRNSTVHDFVPGAGREASAIVVHGSGADVLVEDNRIELGAGPGRDSAVLLAPEQPGDRADGPVVIRGNVLGGGRYTVRQDVPAAAMTDVRISGNRFVRDAEQGPMRVSPRAVLENNIYLDGGRLPNQ
jgi:hypothetical protein